MTMTTVQPTIFVGRQQIYDRDLNVVAYELLFRSNLKNEADVIDADAATSQLLINSVVEIGLDNLVFGRPAFVNFSKSFIAGGYEIPFDPDLLVIELLETVEPDEEIIIALNDLRDQGYTIVLDDYVETDHRECLLPFADIVKVDLRQFCSTRLEQEVVRLRSYPLKLLAEKVETHEEFKRCKSLGFDLYQGFFLSRPQIIQMKAIANNQHAILRLLVKLRDPDATFDEVVDLVKQDISLSLKLLRYVNSLTHGVRSPIDSVRHAAVRLGLQKICQITTLIAMGGLVDKPMPLLEIALVRARTCEILGALFRPECAEIYFTIGLFSTLDAFLDRPLAEILKELPITTEMREALLSHEGPMGWLLGSVIAFERGELNAFRHSGIDHAILQKSYLSALSWANVETVAANSAKLHHED